MSFVGDRLCILSGTGRDRVGRADVRFQRALRVVWGLVPWLGGSVGCPWWLGGWSFYVAV